MRKFYRFFFGILLLLTSQSVSSQWISQSTPLNTQYYTVHFINENTGWATGDALKIVKTTDGGSNWEIVSSPDLTDRGECMHFIDQNTGFIGTYKGRLYRTFNGGLNWSALILQNNSRIFSLDFINNVTGWVAGEGLIYYKTTDSGISWFKPSVTLDNQYKTDVNFINESTGFVTGASNTRIMKSIYGGHGWVEVYVPGYLQSGAPWYATSFINDHTGWVVGLRGYVAKTTNSGDNWNIVSMDTAGFYGWYSDVSFLNDTLGYASVVYVGNYGAIHKTTNGGVNWHYVPVPSSAGSCYNLTFPTPNIAYASGGNGKIYKTENALTGVSGISNTVPESFRLHQNYPNPFNPATNIKFDIRASGIVKLIVYNHLGQEVKTLINESLQPGTYEYSFEAGDLSSGVYFYTLRSRDITETKKMLLVK